MAATPTVARACENTAEEMMGTSHSDRVKGPEQQRRRTTQTIGSVEEGHYKCTLHAREH